MIIDDPPLALAAMRGDSALTATIADFIDLGRRVAAR